MFFRTRFSASAITAFSAIVIARNTWPAAENYWLCSRPSHNRLSTTGSAASNSLGSIRSSAPNAIVARWCVSPSFPWPGSPPSRTPHEQCTHTPVLNCQSAANVSPSEFVCLVCLSFWPLLVHMSVPAFSAGPFRFPAARNPGQFCVNFIPSR